MPTNRTFKGRVRTRMTKTGESYTTAREQLLRKVTELEPTGAPPFEVAVGSTAETPPADDFPTSEAATVRATGKTYPDWFAVLDAWGAVSRTHTEIARWLRDDQGVDDWWSQSVTVAYERARGMRARHEMVGGFSVAVTRTIAVDSATARAAFTDQAIRETWLSAAAMTQRPTRARNTARFDWDTPASRVVVTVAPRDDGQTTVTVSHERLPDAATAEEQKVAWRERLASLRAVLQGATE